MSCIFADYFFTEEFNKLCTGYINFYKLGYTGIQNLPRFCIKICFFVKLGRNTHEILQHFLCFPCLKIFREKVERLKLAEEFEKSF